MEHVSPTSTFESGAYVQPDDMPGLFEVDVFAELQATVDANGLREAAAEALAGILTFETSTGQPPRSLQDIKQETEVFFSNTAIQEIEGLFDQLAAQYAQFCDHNHEASEELNQGALASVQSRGGQLLEAHRNRLAGRATPNSPASRHTKNKKKATGRPVSLAAWLIKHYADRHTRRKN